MTAIPRPEDFPELSPAAWAALEEQVRAFEAAWTKGTRPRLKEFYHAGGLVGEQLLVELAHTELELRLRAGESARVEDYLAAYPALATRPGIIAGLIATEFRFRRRREPSLTAAEFQQRFPEIEVDLIEEPLPSAALPRTNGIVLNGKDPADAILLDPAATRLPQVPGYEMIEELGRGRMGVVYKAMDVRINRTVAVKTLHPGAGPDELERLKREAEAAAAIHHPNVVQVYQIVEHSGLLFVVTECLPGGTFADLAGDPIPAKRAVALMEPAVKAIAVAHAVGIIHRDLKPSNVLITADGTPKVGDFGLSKRLDDDSELTRSGVLAGSPCYMAPEQAAGRRDIGPAADVYALGVLLYELLTGRPPFKGAGVTETLEMARSMEPIPPRQLVPGMPRDIETICLKCLEKDPRRRYANADLLAADLGRFLHGKPVQARPVGIIGRTGRWVGRHPGLGLAWGLFLTAVIGGTTASLWQAHRANASALTAAESERVTQRLLFASDMRLAAEAARVGDPVRVEELLEAHKEVRGGSAFVRNYLARSSHIPHTQIDILEGPVYYVCYSPDGKTLAACGEAGEIQFYAVDSWKRSTTIAANQGELNGLAFAPSGGHLASAGDDGSVVLWDLATGEAVWRQRVYEKQTYQVGFALDGDVLVVCGNDRKLRLLDPTDGRVVASFEADRKSVEGIALSPDRKTLFAAGDGGRASAWDVASGANIWAIERTDPEPRLASVTVSPNGRIAAFGCVASQILLVDVESGRVTHEGPLPTDRPTSRGGGHRQLAFINDQLLAVSSDSGAIQLVAVTSTGGPTIAEVPITSWAAHAGKLGGLAVSGASSLVTTGRDGRVLVWSPEDSSADMEIGVDASAVWQPQRNGIRSTAWIGGIASLPRRVAVLGYDDVQTINFQTGHVECIPGSSGDWASLLAGGGGRRLFAGGLDGQLAAWEIDGDEFRLLWNRKLAEIATVELYTAPRGARWLAAKLLSPTGLPHEDRIAVFDAATGRDVCHREMGDSVCPPVTPDNGEVIASSRGSSVLLLDPQTLEIRSEFNGHENAVRTLAFSRDGRLLASAGLDQRLIVWDAATGTQLRTWRADVGMIDSLDFSPDGTVLLTAMADQPPRFWDVETGRLLLAVSTSSGQETNIWSPAFFSPDGHEVAVGRLHSIRLLDGRPLKAD